MEKGIRRFKKIIYFEMSLQRSKFVITKNYII